MRLRCIAGRRVVTTPIGPEFADRNNGNAAAAAFI
jgi:hypothetical protein